jgi:hypothetical protein
MFALLLRRWLIAAIAVPVAAAGARKLSQKIEERRGPRNKAARALRSGADLLQRVGGRKPRRKGLLGRLR